MGKLADFFKKTGDAINKGFDTLGDKTGIQSEDVAKGGSQILNLFGKLTNTEQLFGAIGNEWIKGANSSKLVSPEGPQSATKPKMTIQQILLFIVMPFGLIIGVIWYIKKSKNAKYRR